MKKLLIALAALSISSISWSANCPLTMVGTGSLIAGQYNDVVFPCYETTGYSIFLTGMNNLSLGYYQVVTGGFAVEITDLTTVVMGGDYGFSWMAVANGEIAPPPGQPCPPGQVCPSNAIK